MPLGVAACGAWCLVLSTSGLFLCRLPAPHAGGMQRNLTFSVLLEAGVVAAVERDHRCLGSACPGPMALLSDGRFGRVGA